MAYDVTKSNGERLSIVADRTVDSSTSSISLIGKNYTGYGEITVSYTHLTLPTKRIV